MKRCLALLIYFCWLANAAVAEESHAGLMSRWYDALVAVDREEISALVSSDATIELKDIGITQTGAEFVASLDEWADAIKGGSIRHKIITDSQDAVTSAVCYTFASSSMMTTEQFVFADRQIVSSTQQTVATNCDNF